MASPYETMDIVVHPSITRTTSFNTELFRQADVPVNSAYIFIDVTAVSGTTPTLTAQLQMRDPASLKWVNITGAVTPVITGVGTTTLLVGPAITGVANSIVNAPIPCTIRIAYTIGGTTPSFTFSAGVSFSA